MRSRRLWVAPVAALLAAGSIAGSSGATRRPAPVRAATTPAPAPLGAAPAGARLDIELPLVADDAGLARFADAVSDPSSPRYGQFASVETLNARYGARPADVAAVSRYLRAVGAQDVSFAAVGQYVSATISVSGAQRAFGVRLARFRDAAGRAYIAPSSLVHTAAVTALPAALRGKVTGVVGLDTETIAQSNEHVALGRVSGPSGLSSGGVHAASGIPGSAYAVRSGKAGGCSPARRTGSFTPNQYLTGYGYRALHDMGLEGQGESVALIEIDGFRPSDINGFVRCFRLPYPHVGVYPVGGLRRPLPAGGESTLDLELLSAAAPKLSHIYVYESSGTAGHVLHAYSSALARGRRPQAISISLGICEPLALQSMGAAGINGVERILRTAVASGVSLLASAGDQGSSSCIRNGRIQDRLAVSYPASSPYVTGVGGTNVLFGARNHIRAEIVWNDGPQRVMDAGGGGLSVVFGRPAWQSAFGQSARIVPDVSMLADLAPGYAIFCTVKGVACGKGGWTGAGGTSAAAPLLTGGILLLDQERRREHRHTLGGLNPLLYFIGQSAARGLVYDDIRLYDNDLGPYLPSGNHQPLGCCAAAAGYDGASGWGSVNLYALSRIVAPPRPKKKKK